MVRRYVLTDREKRIINKYLENDLMLEGFRELKHTLSNLDTAPITEDLTLIQRFLKTA